MIKIRTQGRLSTLLVILALQLLIPLTISIVLIAFLTKLSSNKNNKEFVNRGTILITGGKMTKALQLARLLSKSGYKIILAEDKKYWASGHAWSNCVDSFYLLPPISEGYSNYEKTLLSIVKQEQIDLMIPVSSPISVYRDAKLKKNIGDKLKIFHFTEDELKCLDHKYNLCTKAREIGLTSPEVHLIKSKNDLESFDFNLTKKRYILKSLVYAPVERLKRPLLPFDGQKLYFNGLEISSERPWVLQEFVSGQEFCTHSTVHDGRILLHCCCESSEFQLRYKHVDNQAIYSWVETFVRAMNLTGQISFDFIVNERGEVMPIECNPRTHSAITAFYNSECVADSYVISQGYQSSQIGPCFPRPEARETYWLYHELWELFKCRSFKQFKNQIKILFFGKEAILDPSDPLPFLMVYHWQIPSLLIQALKSKSPWVRIDFNIGKLVEVDGD